MLQGFRCQRGGGKRPREGRKVPLRARRCPRRKGKGSKGYYPLADFMFGLLRGGGKGLLLAGRREALTILDEGRRKDLRLPSSLLEKNGKRRLELRGASANPCFSRQRKRSDWGRKKRKRYHLEHKKKEMLRAKKGQFAEKAPAKEKGATRRRPPQ